MQYRFPEPSTPGGWLARIVGAIVGVLVMIGLFFLGITVFAAAAGVALVVFIVLAVRVWWLRLKMRRAQDGEPRPRPERDTRKGVTLEGEYEERRRD